MYGVSSLKERKTVGKMGKRKSGGLLSTSNPQLNSFEDSPDHGKQIKTDRKKKAQVKKRSASAEKRRAWAEKK
jgi:hypothetical protein